ncbi:hypothetical protein ACHAXR_004083, partial [Thalassiosira sp. AJA248-18]
MPRNIGRSTPSTSRRRQTSPSPYNSFMKWSVLILTTYALVIVLWQHSQITDAPDLAWIISSTKDAFIRGGESSYSSLSKKSGLSRSWLLGEENVLEDDDEDDALEQSDPNDGGEEDALEQSGPNDGGEEDEEGAIIPIDLSVNFLKLITKAPGAPPEPIMAPSASKARSPEDFLPVVVPSEINFRWAHRAREGSRQENSSKIKAYRIIVRKSEIMNEQGGSVVWDSKKINVEDETDGAPDSVDWGGSTKVGQILEWQLQVWDAKDRSNSSNWSKFAVGPESDGWKGKWITHPSDMDTFDKKKSGDSSWDECGLWKLRRPLPLFRTKIKSSDLMSLKTGEISSVLLVISGLGSFRASFDGVPLSTSGPIDPPFTDYSKRVMYRGFDVSSFVLGENEHVESHVIGVTMGSGWWDHRPVSGMAKPKLLPRGPATVIAQVIVTYVSGETRVVGQTGEDGMGRESNWQVSRGHIRESDLFTGEMVDLSVLGDMEGWDTSKGWSDNSKVTAVGGPDPYQEINKWIQPVAYKTEVTGEERKQTMAMQAKAMDRKDGTVFPKRQHFAAPIGKLVPSEIPPVMAMERIAPDEIHDLGGGRWLLDYGKAFSGMLHFDEGVPTPVIPDEKKYPRAHGFKAASEQGDSFITVIYGESLEMTTGDINRVLVAGLGLHDGGPRHVSKKGTPNNSYCFPDDHENVLSQKDIYVVPKASRADNSALFSQARQSHFTTHSFRFAEVCCSAEPPANAHALLYRTAVPEWGRFDSSNVLINGGYELVKNAMNSNMLSVQSDCPH